MIRNRITIEFISLDKRIAKEYCKKLQDLSKEKENPFLLKNIRILLKTDIPFWSIFNEYKINKE